MVKENDGKKWSIRLRRRLLICLVLFTMFLAAVKTVNRIQIGSHIKPMSRGSVKNPYASLFDSHHPLEHVILEAKYFLIDIDISYNALAEEGDGNDSHYGAVTGTFCPLDWSLQKTNPSTVPMFKTLVEQSKHCNPNRVKMDLHSITKKARIFDKAVAEALAQHREVPITRVLQVGGAVFHESRCGSTLASNLLVAANPQAHRVYSESPPPLLAMMQCPTCSRTKQIALLRDVIYLMSRSQTPYETRVFFKIQSIGTHSIPIWTEAFPAVPWVFVYRDPVEVLASHLRHGGDAAKRAPCLRSIDHPPPRLVDLVARHYQNDTSIQTEARTKRKTKDKDSPSAKRVANSNRDLVSRLSNVEFCAAHLATLCESALLEYRNSKKRSSNSQQENNENVKNEGWMLNYASLPDIMWESVMPNHFDVEDLSEAHIERMKAIAQVYSKGFQDKANMPWSQDAEIKQKRATDAMRLAANIYLDGYFEKLEEVSNLGNANDEENVAEGAETG